MFIGQYEHSVDEKGRVAIPAKFRSILKKGATITKGLDGCLFIFAEDKFEKMAAGIGELPLTKSSARLYSRLILASATEVEFDKQGRILLPAFLRKYSRVKGQVVVVGLYDRAEIWSKESWDKMIAGREAKAAEIVEELSETNVE